MAPPAAHNLPQLRMRLGGLPALLERAAPTPPEGLTLRRASADDAEAVGRVLTMAFEDEWSPDRTLRGLIEAPDVRATYLIQAEAPVATASSQVQDGDQAYLHYVGADPAWAGKGLGSIVSLAALRHLAELGYEEARLTTDDPRLPAIRTYLRLGFEPEMVHESHPARWERVLAALDARTGPRP